jgi:hypothetical protein
MRIILCFHLLLLLLSNRIFISAQSTDSDCQYEGVSVSDGVITCEANQSCDISNIALLSLLNTTELVFNLQDTIVGVTVEGPGTASWDAGVELSFDCCKGGCSVTSSSVDTVPVPVDTVDDTDTVVGDDDTEPAAPDLNTNTTMDDATQLLLNTTDDDEMLLLNTTPTSNGTNISGYDDDWGAWPSNYFLNTSSAHNYSYYDDLLGWALSTGQFATENQSSVVKISEYGESIRIGKIVSMFDVSACCFPYDEMDQLVIARAVVDFNNRSSLITPSVAELTQGCNFYVSLKIHELNENTFLPETFLDPIRSWQQQVNATLRPMGFVGSFVDLWTGILASLSSGVSKSAELGDKGDTSRPKLNVDAIPYVSPYSYLDEAHSDRESTYIEGDENEMAFVLCCANTLFYSFSRLPLSRSPSHFVWW